MFYLRCEDLASALVGPFKTKREAKAHERFCRLRGDSASIEVVDHPVETNFTMTPEEDKKDAVMVRVETYASNGICVRRSGKLVADLTAEDASMILDRAFSVRGSKRFSDKEEVWVSILDITTGDEITGCDLS